jgi:tRNA threonylcarbamoyladenosine biosynthesis protein TsaE
MCYQFFSTSERDTQRLGQALADVLPDGTTVALHGTLGAGKTRLVQAIAAGCKVPAGQVVSPTFVLCHTYHGSRTIHHFDAFRVRDDDEFLELGAEEYFASSGLTIVEWAERVEGCLPRTRLQIEITIAGATQRTFEFLPVGESLAIVPRHLAQHLES